MSIVKEDFTFIHIPKTAGTSVESLIGGSGHMTLAQIAKRGDDFFGNEIECLFVPYEELTEDDPPSKMNLLKPVVFFTRNPYDRLVSAYHFIKQINFTPLPESFEAFVRSQQLQDFVKLEPTESNAHAVHFIPQFKFVECKDNFEKVHYKFECLQTHFSLMKERFAIKGNLPHAQTSKHAHYSSYYTEELANIVANAYSEDFVQFGYARDSWR